MATEEWIKRAINNGKTYEELPPRVRTLLPISEWKFKVKEHCIQRGFSWSDTLASSSCSEQEYYEDLLRFYRHNYRLFPYHLADYVCRVLRVPPFRYYCDLLYTVMREEKSYDQIPNFTAADIVKLVGIGRNEYIDIMNKCKAKKLLWRVNKAIVKEHLPTDPLDLDLQPWWIVHVVNLGESEYRSLIGDELKLCQDAARPGAVRVKDVSPRALQALSRRGLVYLEVPIRPTDHVSIPPLEGFVSNRDSERGEDRGDPLEAVLYAVFVATSARASIAELATILQVDLPKLQAAISLACRLGFATRLPNPLDEDMMVAAPSLDVSARGEVNLELALDEMGILSRDAGPGESPRPSEDGATRAPDGDGAGVALVVDAELTSYLMMGAMSPGLKRHSVTLFEGGRVTGAEVIAELIVELDASVEAAAGFEGEMQRLATYARALSTTLQCVRGAAEGRPVELLRKESLAGLAPAAACRVLSHAYAAVVPIAPLPYPPLPLSPLRPGPTNFGPTAEAATPWVHLALYSAMRSGPVSVVLVCGQRLWRLPPQLRSCTHALIWPWNMDAVRAHEAPIAADAPFLLHTLNECLSRTAVMVQPLSLHPTAKVADMQLVDVPLPMPQPGAAAVVGIDAGSGQAVSWRAPEGLAGALRDMGLEHAVGFIRMMRADDVCQEDLGEEASRPQSSGTAWIPQQLLLGIPLVPDTLCWAVCRQAEEAKFLEAASRAAHSAGQAALQQQLFRLISDYGACSNCLASSGRDDENLSYVDLPIHNLLFDGTHVHHLDYSDYQQGVPVMCLD